jgi:hypothetical protein
VKTSVAYESPSSTRTRKFALRPAPNSSSKVLDDRASEALNALGDRLAASIEALEQAIGVINEASYSDPRWDDRARARLLLGRVLTEIAKVNVELSRPLPVFRADVGTYRPTVRPRYRRDPEIADIRTAVPAALVVEA